MSKVQTLRAFVNQRLTLAADEIFELFERTIAEYEEELCRQHKLLDAVFKPEVRLHRADVQQLLVSKEEVPPEQQEWSPLVDQEESPELPHIKEEQEELWSSQEGEQPQGLEEADINKVTFTPVPVKSEEDEENPQSSQLHQKQSEQMKTEDDGEDCGGPEPARNFNPDSHLSDFLSTNDKKSHPSEPETDDSCDWEETREPQSGSNPLQNNEEHVSDVKCNTVESSVISSECAANERCWQKHDGNQTGVKQFSCSVCGRRYTNKSSLSTHMRRHTGDKCFSCSVCKKPFVENGNLVQHMRVHTGEKPFKCSVCGKEFTQSSNLTQHMRLHTGEKPFSCSICKKKFSRKENAERHMKIHTGEKPFRCSVCDRRFTQKSSLNIHLGCHTGEKPFSCSVCKKRFRHKSSLSIHMRNHTEDKPFRCSYCGKGFTQSSTLASHLTVHTGEKPFSCSVCKASFRLKSSLSIHKRYHTEEKLFSCSYCGKRFNLRMNLTSHLRVHTGEKPFSCSVCDKNFMWIHIFKKHKCHVESNGSK